MSDPTEQPEQPETTDQPTGEGGPLGTPGPLTDEQPPSQDQDENAVVSGGGVVEPDEDGLSAGESSTDVD